MKPVSAIRLWRFSTFAFAAVLAVAAGLLWSARAAAPAPLDPIAFEDVAARAGVAFVLQNSATPARRQMEPRVGGVAVFDYNGDGKPDLYFVKGPRQPQLDKP